MTKRAILVLGFHRSGTSALTGLLAQMGLRAPNTLIDPVTNENAKGFWESTLLSAFNERLLQRQGRRWDDPFIDPQRAHEQVYYTQQDVQELSALITSEFSLSELSTTEGAGQRVENKQALVIKDPRLCLLLPLWQEVLLKLDYQTAFVLVVRHPLECAASLFQRNEIAEHKALLLWLQYSLTAERQTRDASRVVVRYNDLLAQPQQVIQTLAKELELALNQAPDHLRELAQFIDPKLAHQRVSQDQMSRMSELSLRVYGAFNDLAAHDSISVLDDAAKGLSDVLVMVLPELRGLHDDLALLASQKHELHVSLRSAQQKLEQITQQQTEQIRQLSGELDKLTLRCEQLAKTLAAVNQETEQRKTELEVLSHQHAFTKLQLQAHERSFLGRATARFQQVIHWAQSFNAGAFMVLKALHHADKEAWQRYRAIRSIGTFDALEYWRQHPELKGMLTHPLIHYVTVGHRLGYPLVERKPS